jgi:hypothetical protein
MDWTGSMTPPPIDPRLASPFEPFTEYIPRSTSISSSRRSPPRSDCESLAGQDHEIAFLLRYFCEGPGRWMDLFDLGTYYASYIPVQARENPLLKYSAVACAAKALARVQIRNPMRQAKYLDGQSVDWEHKAAVYYDNAVSLLLQALKTDPTMTPDDSECEFTHHSSMGYGGHAAKRRRTSSNVSLNNNTDELLAASAILSIYDYLDTSIPEWSKHLNGAKCLLMHSQERMMPLQLASPTSPMSTSGFNFVSKARRATFWNIARQDMYAARKYAGIRVAACH